ncbi:hypothetical protein CVU37_13205 [candidate division BRC1 bacterium HGW-BRC1-1]|nr:MAG: hypothetical protein CVU37_13205 [candidate division BRC1 bacterium HGW-BRC1-1]
MMRMKRSLALGAMLLVAGAVAVSAAEKRAEKPTLPLPPRMLWLDNESDPIALASREAVSAMLDKAQDAGFNIVVGDVRSWHGVSFWQSDVGPRASTIEGYPQDFDFLSVLVEEAHKRGMQAHAGMNVFVGGAKAATTGIARQHPEWESVVYDRVAGVQWGDGKTTTARGVNERAGAGVSVFNRTYAEKLYARDTPGNAADGVKGKVASRWVSDNTTTTHWLQLDWKEPQAIDEVVLHFPRGVPAPGVRLMADGKNLASVDANAATELRLPVTSGTQARTLKVEFSDPGNDAMGRLDEIYVMTPAGVNVATSATDTADSSIGRSNAWWVVARNDCVTTVVREASLGAASLAIPPDGFVAVWDDARTSPPAVGERISVAMETRMQRESDHAGGPLIYLNPVNPEVQEHLLALIKEVMGRYDVDGVTLDRVRFDNFKTDFSDVSRRAFEKSQKLKVAHWPDDIYVPANLWTGEEMHKGALYDKWVAWRPSVIREFVEKCRALADEHKVLLGDYVGGWYSEYWEVGVNWASQDYDPSAEFDWAPKGYGKTGYAQLLDYLSPGVYYTAVKKTESPTPDTTIEGGIEIAQRVTGFMLPLAPGLYVPNLNSDVLFEAAVRQSLEQGGGVMIFSQTSMDKQNRWDAARRGLEARPLHPE